jgi:hypothetical protein
MTGSFFNPLHEIISRQVESVVIPNGETMYAGYAVMAEDLKADFNSAGAFNDANRQVYAGTKVADITADVPVILMNAPFEEMADGRRPVGQPLYTEYPLTDAGAPALAIRPEINDKYEFSMNVLVSGTAVAGDLIIPTANSGKWTLVHPGTDATTALVLKVEKVENIGLGGIGAMGTFSAMICRVIRTVAPAAQA